MKLTNERIADERLQELTNLTPDGGVDPAPCDFEIERMARELLALREQNRWIAVSEKLPLEPPTATVHIEGSFEVWQTFFKENPQIGRFHRFRDGSSGWGLPNVSGDCDGYVTHYRPLPRAPEGGTNGETDSA